MAEMSKQIEILLDKVGDTTNVSNVSNNNIIVLNGFGNEDISYITGDFVKKLISAGPYACIPKLVRRIHFHPKHKENHNIRIPNKSRNMAKIYNGNRIDGLGKNTWKKVSGISSGGSKNSRICFFDNPVHFL